MKGSLRVWLWRLAWLLGVLLLLVLLAWGLVPPLVKWQAQSRLSTALDRNVTIGSVGFTPWTLELTINDLVVAAARRPTEPNAQTPSASAPPTGSPASSTAMAAAPQTTATASTSASISAPPADSTSASTPPAQPPLLQVARIHADISSSSLIKLAPVIETLQIDKPEVHVVRLAPGHYDIDDLIERYAERKDEESSGPSHFALYNLQLRDGALRLDDRPVGRVQAVTDLQLTLPFISSLPPDVEVKVKPRVAFRLNGAVFDSGAQATPFAATNAGTLKLAISDLDVRPYLGYLPASLPLRLTRGTLSSDLGLEFALPKDATGSVVLHGTLQARDVAATDAAGAPLLAWQQLEIGLRDIEPFARKLDLDSLRIDGAQLHVTRDAAGRLNLAQLAKVGGKARSASEGVLKPTAAVAASAGATASAASAPVTPSASSAPATSSAPSAPSASAASAASAPSAATAAASPASNPRERAARAAPSPWQIRIAAFDLKDARIAWRDASVQPAVALQLDPVQLSLKQIDWPVARPMPLSLDATLHEQSPAAKPTALGKLHIAGPVTDHGAQLDIELSGLSLAALGPYLAQQLVPQAAGQLSATGRMDWSNAAASPHLRVALKNATLDDLKLRERGSQGDALALKQLTLGDVQVDMAAQHAVLGKVRLTQPVLQVTRNAQGVLNLQQWRVTPAAAEAAREATIEAPRAAPGWRVQLQDLALDGGRIEVVDSALRQRRSPVRLELSGVHLAVHGLTWPAESDQTASVQFGARIGAPAGPRRAAPAAGSLNWDGDIGLAPLKASGSLQIERFPVQLFTPYLGGHLPVRLVHAEAGYKGKIDLGHLPAGLAVSGSGDVLIGDVRADTLPDPSAGIPGGDELISWQSLSLKHAKFAMKPKARPKLDIGSAVLSDFYSRLVVTEQGHFNLQELRPGQAGSAQASAQQPAEAAAEGSSAAAPLTPPARASVSTQKDATATAKAPAGRAETPQAVHLPLDLTIDTTQLVNGKIDFRDHFIKPNYSAALTELNGQIGTFSSTSPQMAQIELRGRAEGTALLEISGAVNPLASPMQLDIHAKASDLELAPLSPYAAKYAGYAIERGKLSMNVSYKVDADGLLTAENQLILNQLTFGEKVESPQATSLPVRLAVALLKDRNGVIDLNLPISGSLNDPQFSLGALIGKVIGNLLVKAVTAPFALLTGGGGHDLSEVGFEPGTAIPTKDGQAGIDRVAKALTDKPSLTMTVTGAADPVAEHDAYRKAMLDKRLQDEERREAVSAGHAASAPTSRPPPLSADERARLIRRLYRRSDFADKPRNVFGFAKDIPVAQMEELLLQDIPVNDDAMRELALQRGVAVRDALIAKGLKSERLFLAAPKLRSSKPGETWTPQVELSLEVK